MKGLICEVWRCILNSYLVHCYLSGGCFIGDKPKLFHRTELFSLNVLLRYSNNSNRSSLDFFFPAVSKEKGDYIAFGICC